VSEPNRIFHNIILVKLGSSRARWIALPILVALIVSLGTQSQAAGSLTVKWVDDGDTIVLSDGRRVRYIGIDTPEVRHGSQPAEPFGNKAKAVNKAIVYHKIVRLEYDQEKKDHYGRVLAYVFLADNSFVNKQLLESGLAYCLYREPNTSRFEELLQAQREAMTAKKGIWSNWQAKPGRYIGNKRSMRFHLDTCPAAQHIRKKHKIDFTNQWTAYWFGYAPDKGCVKPR